MRRPPEREEETTGVGVYSDMIESGLAESGVRYDRVVVNMSIRYGIGKCIMDGFVRPFFKALGARYNAIHATDEFCCLYFPLMKGRKVVTFHHISKGLEGKSPFYMLFWRIISKMAVKHADTIIAVSEQTRDELVSEYYIPAEKIRVLTHMPPYNFRKLGLKRERIIGYVGSLIERKNVAGAIRAFSLFTEMPGTNNYRFVVCGKGPLMEELQGMTLDLGIEDRVDFISELSQKELETFYNTMTVYANPSMHEGLGLAPLEAQACGTPVVSFATAEIPDEVSLNFIKSVDEVDFARNLHRLATDLAYWETVVSRIGKSVDFKEKYMEKILETYFK